MIKHQEISDPQSCLNRAQADEMVFVLLGRDIAAPATIRFWAEQRLKMGKNDVADPQIEEALSCALAMEEKHNNPLNKTWDVYRHRLANFLSLEFEGKHIDSCDPEIKALNYKAAEKICQILAPFFKKK